MPPRSRFIVELRPPTNPASLDKFHSRISKLVGLTGRVSIASKPSGPKICGFETSLNLARYLLKKDSETEIIFHVTCHDLNKVNVRTRLSSLKDLGVSNILVITGDDYNPQSGWKELFYQNSNELLSDIILHYNWFETIAVGGYPGGDGRRSHNNEQECTRLSSSLKLGANAIYTQCVFDLALFQEFNNHLKSRFPRIEVVPSVALFKGSADLEKVADLTRVKSSSFNQLRGEMDRIRDPNDLENLSIKYLEHSCRKLLVDVSVIDLCTFGQFNLAESLIERLTGSLTGAYLVPELVL